MKKTIGLMLTLIMILAMTLTLTACVGANGTPGNDGKSAYQVWLDNGNDGTEGAFLEWLKGAAGSKGVDGTNGTNGKSAYELYQDEYGYDGTETEWLDDLLNGKFASMEEFTITFRDSLSVKRVFGTNKVKSGQKITAPPVAARDDGREFEGWYVSLTDFSPDNRWSMIGHTVTSNMTLYANWYWGAGAGTEANPYNIITAADLENLAKRVNDGDSCDGKYFTLRNDLNLGGMEWTPIGRDGNSSDSKTFYGIFDGNGYKVSNFRIMDTVRCAGLFGNVSGIVKNLGVEKVTIKFDSADVIYAGGLVGYNSGGTIDNCYVTNGNIIVSSSNASTSNAVAAGGLVGYNSYGSLVNTITNSSAACAVSATTPLGTANAGGLIGYNGENGGTANCYATGNIIVSGKTARAGGFVGFSVSKITKSYATGTVTAVSTGTSSSADHVRAGGFAGWANGGNIEQCYATGAVMATAADAAAADAGGLIGQITGNAILNCYALGSAAAKSNGNAARAGGLVGFTTKPISYSYARGNVAADTGGSSRAIAGGLVGQTANDAAVLTSCLAMGNATASSVSGGKDAGGLIGWRASGTVSNCYRYENQAVSAGTGGTINANGETCTITQLNTADFYTHATLYLHWDKAIWNTGILGFLADKFPTLNW